MSFKSNKPMASFMQRLAPLLLMAGCLAILSSCSHRKLPQEPSSLKNNRPLDLAHNQQTIAANDVTIQPVRTKKCIVIDPGHGGHDHGTQSTSKPPLIEKQLNLKTALLVQTFLRQMGFQTIMTRSSDTFISLGKRSELANSQKCDLFVSIHYNSAPSPQAHGIEIFYYQDKVRSPRNAQSKLLAEKILGEVISSTEAKSRGVKHGNLAVLRETKMPAVLIEGGFLTNSGETEKLRDGAYVRKLAWSIAKGVQEYVNGRKPSEKD